MACSAVFCGTLYFMHLALLEAFFDRPCSKNQGVPKKLRFNVNAKNYRLSKETTNLDHFLSHDWGSSRWLKLIALLVVHNSAPAFFTSLATSLLVGVLVSCNLLPYRVWTALFGHCSFFFVFCFWQRIRRVFFRPFMVFLDTLCIAQHDETRLCCRAMLVPGSNASALMFELEV